MTEHGSSELVVRAVPTQEALELLCADIEPGGRIIDVRAMGGGISSAIHRLDLVSRNGHTRSVVLRRFNGKVSKSHLDVAEREFQLLQFLRTTDIPVPEPIWLDRDGLVFGRPSLVLSIVDGRPQLAPVDIADWIRQHAELLGRIHGLELDVEGLQFLPDLQATVKATMDKVEMRSAGAHVTDFLVAKKRFLEGWPIIKLVPGSLLHGDFWPGNTLWKDGKLVSVIDWEEPAYGDRGADVAICRLDIAWTVGLEAADEFLEAYRRIVDEPVPNLALWDLYAACRPFPDAADWQGGYHSMNRMDIKPEYMRRIHSEFVANACTRLSASL